MPAELNRVEDVSLLGRRSPRHQPLLHGDITGRSWPRFDQRCARTGTEIRVNTRQLAERRRWSPSLCFDKTQRKILFGLCYSDR